MIPRTAPAAAQQLPDGLSIVTIAGLRQSGKTTLARERVAAPTLVYGGSCTHARRGVEVVGWDAVGQVFGEAHER